MSLPPHGQLWRSGGVFLSKYADALFVLIGIVRIETLEQRPRQGVFTPPAFLHTNSYLRRYFSVFAKFGPLCKLYVNYVNSM